MKTKYFPRRLEGFRFRLRLLRYHFRLREVRPVKQEACLVKRKVTWLDGSFHYLHLTLH